MISFFSLFPLFISFTPYLRVPCIGCPHSLKERHIREAYIFRDTCPGIDEMFIKRKRDGNALGFDLFQHSWPSVRNGFACDDSKHLHEPLVGDKLF